MNRTAWAGNKCRNRRWEHLDSRSEELARFSTIPGFLRGAAKRMMISETIIRPQVLGVEPEHHAHTPLVRPPPPHSGVRCSRLVPRPGAQIHGQRGSTST